MGFWQDFKRFAFRGNLIDLAVGVIIGGAFGKIVTALVEDMLMPVLALGLPGGAWREAVWVLREARPGAEPVVLRWGHFAGALLDLALVAMALFVLVWRILGRGPSSAAPAAPAPTTRACPDCLEAVPRAARRCRACTSALPPG